MVTRIGGSRKAHLYLEEWMEARGLSFEDIGGQLDVSRTTVWRWVKEQHRLDPGKIGALAGVFQCEPEELYRPPPKYPNRPSIDALLANADDADFNVALDVARRLARHGS